MGVGDCSIGSKCVYPPPPTLLIPCCLKYAWRVGGGGAPPSLYPSHILQIPEYAKWSQKEKCIIIHVILFGYTIYILVFYSARNPSGGGGQYLHGYPLPNAHTKLVRCPFEVGEHLDMLVASSFLGKKKKGGGRGQLQTKNIIEAITYVRFKAIS